MERRKGGANRSGQLFNPVPFPWRTLAPAGMRIPAALPSKRARGGGGGGGGGGAIIEDDGAAAADIAAGIGGGGGAIGAEALKAELMTCEAVGSMVPTVTGSATIRKRLGEFSCRGSAEHCVPALANSFAGGVMAAGSSMSV